MKFKIGDRVRIREDLKLYNDYDDCDIIDEMLEYTGDIATILKASELNNCYKINIDHQEWIWTDEMLEPVEVIEYKNKKYDVYQEIDCNNDKINKVLQLQEVKEEILDEEEKEYLNNVIKPFRNRIDNITKRECIYYHLDRFYILIHFKSGHDMPFPIFFNKKMYAGMIGNKPYTLEDLDL